VDGSGGGGRISNIRLGGGPKLVSPMKDFAGPTRRSVGGQREGKKKTLGGGRLGGRFVYSGKTKRQKGENRVL